MACRLSQSGDKHGRVRTGLDWAGDISIGMLRRAMPNDDDGTSGRLIRGCPSATQGCSKLPGRLEVLRLLRGAKVTLK